jgi:hypothetical protein
MGSRIAQDENPGITRVLRFFGMTRVGALLPMILASACYDWTVPQASGAPAAPDAGPEASVGADAAVVADGLVAWWRFEEEANATARDSSGHGNDAQPFGGVGRVPGKSGDAASFNGQDAYFHVADNGSIRSDAGFTIALWMNIDDVPYDQRVFETFAVWGLKLNRRSPQLSMPGGYGMLDGQLPVGSGWHHVAFTYESGTAVGYIDGNAVNFVAPPSFPRGPNPTQTPGGVMLGASYAAWPPANDGSPAYFTKGAVDDVRIYSRPLAPAEVAKLAGL